jgi:hypothetical protein
MISMRRLSPGLFFLFFLFPGVLFLFLEAEQTQLLLDVAALLAEPLAAPLTLVQRVGLHAAYHTLRHRASLLLFYTTVRLPIFAPDVTEARFA